MTQIPPDVASDPVQPLWTVQTVHAHDGGGEDFAYMIGRGPIGAAHPDRCRAELAALLATIPPGRRAPPGWRRPKVTSSMRIDQPYGPLTPLVQGQGIAIASASAVDLVDFITRQLDADWVFGPRSVLAQAVAAARPAGRVSEVEAAHAAAEQIVRHVCGPGGRSTRWRQVLDITGMASEETPQLLRGMSGALLDGTEAALTVQVVADVADEGGRLAGIGPWRAAASPSGMVAGPAWFAGEAVLAAVRQLLTPMDPPSVALLGHVYLAARDGWGDLLMRLRGWAVTSAVGAPAASNLLKGSPAGAFLSERPDIDGLVTEWVCCMTAALARRAQLTAEEVERLHVPTRRLVPSLRSVLNSTV